MVADLTIELHGLDTLQRAAERAPELMNREMRATMEVSVGMLEIAVVDNTPVGATGLARKGITTDIKGSGVDLTGRVYSMDEPIKTASLETGRKPGTMPPIAPIELWVTRKIGAENSRVIAFLIARAIGRRGTKGARMFQKAYESEKPAIEKLWARRIAAIIERAFR